MDPYVVHTSQSSAAAGPADRTSYNLGRTSSLLGRGVLSTADAFERADFHHEHDRVAQIARDVEQLIAGQRRLELKMTRVAQGQDESIAVLDSISKSLESGCLTTPPALDSDKHRPTPTASPMADAKDAMHHDQDPGESDGMCSGSADQVPSPCPAASRASEILEDGGERKSKRCSVDEPSASASGRASVRKFRLSRDNESGREARSSGTGRPSDSDTNMNGRHVRFSIGSQIHEPSMYTSLPEGWPSTIPLRQVPSAKPYQLFDASKSLAFVERSMDVILRTRSPGLAGGSIAYSTPVSERNSHASPDESLIIHDGVGSGSCLLAPTSPSRLCFDVLSLLVLAYDYTSMPYFLAWDEPFPTAASYVNVFFWTLDIMLNFRTGFYAKGILMMTSREIALHYVKTHFTVDVMLISLDVVTLLFDLMDAEGSQGDFLVGTKAARVAKFARFIRIVRILRIGRAAEAFERLGDVFVWLRSSHGENYVYVTQVLLFVLWVSHVLSCAWYALGRSAASDTGASWLDTQASVRSMETYRDADFMYQYLTSMHWSLTQMTPGSMQVFPENSAERALNIACLIFGLLFLSSMVSSVATRVTTLRMQMHQQTKMMHELSRFLRKAMISPALAITAEKQVIERLRKQHQQQTKVANVNALKFLPDVTREELKFELSCPYLFRLPFLRICTQVEKAVVRRLASEACNWLTLHTADEVVFQAGNLSVAAYVVVSGGAVYNQDPLMAKDGDRIVEHVDVGRWVAEAALWCLWHHVGDLTTSVASEVMQLGAERFSTVMMESRVVWEFVSIYSKVFHERVISAMPPTAHWPHDLAVQHTGYDDIIASAPRNMQFATGLVTAEILRNQNTSTIAPRFFWERHSPLTLRSFSMLSSFRATKDLAAELRNGTSIIVVTPSGEVQRVTVIAVVELKGPGGQLFTRLGRYAAGKFKAGCMLPGTKLHEGVTFQTLLEQDLALLKDAVNVYSLETTVEWKMSDRYRVQTKYTKHVHHATLDDNFDMSQLPSARHAAPAAQEGEPVALDLQQCPHVKRTGGPRDVYAFATDQAVYLYSWLSDKEFEDLSSPGGEQALTEWLCSNVDEEHLRGLPAVPPTLPAEQLPATAGECELVNL